MELYLNQVKVDLAVGEVFAVTVQSNDITSLDKLQSSYSNTVTLPPSVRNRAALQSADVLNSQTDIPYRVLDAAVLHNGMEVLARPIATLNGVGSGGFEVDVFSGVINLLDRLGDKSIQELDLSRYRHIRDITNIELATDISRSAEDGYIYPYEVRHADFTRSNLQGRYQYPAVFVKTVFDQIMYEAGVTYTGMEEFAEWPDMVMPFTNDKALHTQQWIDERSYDNVHTSGLIILPDNLFYGIIEIEQEVNILRVPEQADTHPAKHSFRLEKDGVIIETLEQSITQTGMNTFKGRFTLKEMEDLDKYKIYVSFVNVVHTSDPLANGFDMGLYDSFRVFYRPDPVAFYRTEWDLAINLPDISQKDFLKCVKAWFNLLFSFDAYTNTLLCAPFNQLEQNKANALDWSDRLVYMDNAKPDMQFKFGDFAQRNWFKYKGDNETANAYFAVNNYLLAPEKTVIELPFEASDEQDSIILPSFTKTPEGEYTYKGLSARVGLLKRGLGEEYSTTLSDGSTVYFPLMAGITFAPLRWQTILNEKYTTLQGILERTKGIRPYFLLSTMDVHNYNAVVPVWLEQYQEYFYLNSIEEFVGDEPTLCQLWRL